MRKKGGGPIFSLFPLRVSRVASARVCVCVCESAINQEADWPERKPNDFGQPAAVRAGKTSCRLTIAVDRAKRESGRGRAEVRTNPEANPVANQSRSFANNCMIAPAEGEGAKNMPTTQLNDYDVLCERAIE